MLGTTGLIVATGRNGDCMSEHNWKNGDRVKLKPHDSWIGPYKGWAERGRGATVRSVFTPAGRSEAMVSVIFDRSRAPIRMEYFSASEVMPYGDE